MSESDDDMHPTMLPPVRQATMLPPVRQATMLPPVRQATQLSTNFTAHLPKSAKKYNGVDVALPIRQTRKSNCTSTVVAMIALDIDNTLNKSEWFNYYAENGGLNVFAPDASFPRKEDAIAEFNRHSDGNLAWKLNVRNVSDLGGTTPTLNKENFLVFSMDGHVVLVSKITDEYIVIRDPLTPFVNLPVTVADLRHRLQLQPLPKLSAAAAKQVVAVTSLGGDAAVPFHWAEWSDADREQLSLRYPIQIPHKDSLDKVEAIYIVSKEKR
jgi:hypothetical protein